MSICFCIAHDGDYIQIALLPELPSLVVMSVGITTASSASA